MPKSIAQQGGRNGPAIIRSLGLGVKRGFVLSREEAYRWTRAGILAAFAIVLSYVETFIPLPIPVPGAKLGFANIPILMALVMLDTKSALAIAVIKTLVTGFLFGSPIMIPDSAAGTLLAFAGMRLLLNVPGLHLMLVSIVGSILHIAGQLAVAALMLETMLVWYSFPILLVVACFTGALTGKVAAFLIESLEGSGSEKESSPIVPLAASTADANSLETLLPTQSRRNKSNPLSKLDLRLLLPLLVIYIVLVFILQGPLALGICALVAIAAAIATHMTLKDAAKALLPLMSILVITSVAQVLYVQRGTVLFTLGPVAVTEEALITIGVMVLRLVCIMLASVAFMRATTAKELMEALKSLLAPLEKMGVRTTDFLLACNLAFQFIPVLTNGFKQLKAQRTETNPGFGQGGLLRKLRDYQTLIPPLAQSAFAYADEVASEYAAE